MTNEELKRYSRHLLLSEIGKSGQEKLKAASVLVIGAGGLGCPVLQYLGAAGVGRIGIIDDDRVDISNLQRQILYTTEDVGLPKATQAKHRLEAQNPFIKIEAYTERLTPENCLAHFANFDIIVDGSDNFATRYLVNDACVILTKPLVFASIFKFEGQVSVFNYKGGPTYRCLFPEPPKEGEVPNCSEIGVLGVLPGIAGSLQANEVIKLITGIGEVLSGKLLVFDALSMMFSTLSFSLNPENTQITTLIDYEVFCGTRNENNSSIRELTIAQLKEKITLNKELELVDVRTKEEFDQFNIGGRLIPLSELPSHYTSIAKDKEVVVFCQTGKRSKSAVEFLKQKGYQKIFTLKEGLSNWE